MTAKRFMAAIRSGDLEGATAAFHQLPPGAQTALRPHLAELRGEGAAVQAFADQARMQRRTGASVPPIKGVGSSTRRMG